MPRYKFLNSVTPQTVVGPGVSTALGCSEIFVTVTADCFVCINPTGVGTNGAAVGATNGHFMAAGSSLPFSLVSGLDKLGVNTGTVYISALG